jgi:hypothetical protein
MLMFVIEEWEKKNSIVGWLKGYKKKKTKKTKNKYKEISAEDSRIIRKEKEKHNALYHLYFNIINIAIFI